MCFCQRAETGQINEGEGLLDHPGNHHSDTLGGYTSVVKGGGRNGDLGTTGGKCSTSSGGPLLSVADAVGKGPLVRSPVIELGGASGRGGRRVGPGGGLENLKS